MTDIDRGSIAGSDQDRLPWLEAVDDEDANRGVGAGKLIAALVAALLVIGLVVGGVFWLRDRSVRGGERSGDGELIAAPAGSYKVRPAEPGGMKVEGEGDASYAASQGASPTAPIDISKAPEAPLKTGTNTGTKLADASAVQTKALPPSKAAPAAVATPPAPAAKPSPSRPEIKAVEVKPAKPKPAETKTADAKPAAKTEPAAAAGPSVQLGAFGSEAKANAAWSNLSGRFPALKPLSHKVTSVTTGGKTLYRLRASAGSAGKANAVCRALQSAKEPCNVLG